MSRTDPANDKPGLIVGYKGEAGSDVLVFARRRARASGENVQAVTVYIPGRRRTARAGSTRSGWCPSFGDIRRFGEEQKAGYQDALDQALETLPAELMATGQLLDGSVVDALSDLTPDTVDLLICGSRGYGPRVACCWAGSPPGCSGTPGSRSSSSRVGELSSDRHSQFVTPIDRFRPDTPRNCEMRGRK